MRIHGKWLATTAILTVGFAFAPPAALRAQTSAALTGQVSSPEEGAMEGVLVSARKTGASFTVTVVSNDKGHYSFPAAPARARPLYTHDPRGRLRAAGRARRRCERRQGRQRRHRVAQDRDRAASPPSSPTANG